MVSSCKPGSPPISGRPFDDAESMNRALVDGWNETVGDDDVVWALGDSVSEIERLIVAGPHEITTRSAAAAVVSSSLRGEGSHDTREDEGEQRSDE